MLKELRQQILKGDIDINNKELFFPALIKGFLYDIRRKISLRGFPVPHFILNTGDDTLYLEVKGQNQAIEPQEVSNEDFVYNQIPRCIVSVGSISIPKDDMTNNASRGILQYETKDEVVSFNAEFRRIPITLNISLKYYLDNYTDSLAMVQMLISKLNFNNLFYIQYMGQTLPVSYMFPEGADVELTTEIDGLYQDSKLRTISLDLEVESCYPLYNHNTVAETSAIISNYEHNLETGHNPTEINTRSSL